MGLLRRHKHTWILKGSRFVRGAMESGRGFSSKSWDRETAQQTLFGYTERTLRCTGCGKIVVDRYTGKVMDEDA